MKIQSSYIFLRNLRFHAFHGMLPQECITGNDYLVNARIKFPLSDVFQTDCITDTISYADAYECIRREMEKPSQLLEHVAGRIGKCLIDSYPAVEEVDIEIMKINPPMGADCDGAGVELHLTNGKN